MSSMHGSGTDCYIYLRSMQDNVSHQIFYISTLEVTNHHSMQAPEQIPIYSAMTSKTYKDKSQGLADDWTGSELEKAEES